MKKNLLCLLIFFPFLLYAQTIEEKLEVIQKTSGKERMELVNQLKLQIAQLNETQREEAINILQKNKMHNNSQRKNHTRQDDKSHNRQSQSGRDGHGNQK